MSLACSIVSEQSQPDQTLGVARCCSRINKRCLADGSSASCSIVKRHGWANKTTLREGSVIMCPTATSKRPVHNASFKTAQSRSQLCSVR